MHCRLGMYVWSDRMTVDHLEMLWHVYATTAVVLSCDADSNA